MKTRQQVTVASPSNNKMRSIHRMIVELIAVLGLLPCSIAFAPNVNPLSYASPRSTMTTHHFRGVYNDPISRRVNRIDTSTTTPQLTSSSALGSLSETATNLATSLFRYQGPVPFLQAFGINAILFAALQSKLNTMLTPSGFASSLVLGTMLWATLGWRGWTLCVLYLFLGQAVTKVKFEDKEKRGIAEGRGGRRGPENVW